MNDGKHGVALIINNIDWPGENKRVGAEEDAKLLQKSFEAIGYQVIAAENLKADAMKETLTTVCMHITHKDNDSFICYISSHGCKDGVYGVDSIPVSVDELSKVLEPDECSHLRDKPKIFFIQACRGETASVPIDVGPGSEPPKGGDNENIVPSVPRRADFYFSYATDPDHLAARHPYPQLLSEYLKKHSAQFSLDEIVMKVHEKVASEVHDLKERGKHMQIGQVVHTMRGPVYFK